MANPHNTPLISFLKDEWSDAWLNYILRVTKCTPTMLSNNPNLTMNTIQREKYLWDFDNVSNNPNLTMKMIMQCPNASWNWYVISRNPNINMDYVKNFPHFPWNFSSMSNNPNLTMEIILQFRDKPWNWYDISKHKNITMDDIKNIPCWGLYAGYVSLNPNLTIEFLKNNQCWVWDWNEISRHKNITIRDIADNINLKWNFTYVSQNPNLTMKDIIDHPTWNWNWDYISSHPNITAEDIENNMDKPWYWQNILNNNPNLTWKFVLNHAKSYYFLGGVAYNLKSINKYCDDIGNSFTKYIVSNPHLDLINYLLNMYPKFRDMSLSNKWTDITLDERITITDIKTHPEIPWAIHELHRKSFDIDRNNFIQQRTMQTNLAMIFDHLTNPIIYANGDCVLTVGEQVFCNDYLVRLLLKF